jgi:hypothetical protein
LPVHEAHIKFQVICPNKILAEMSLEDAHELAAARGTDPVHPSIRAYKVIAEGLIRDLQSTYARYTNPPKGTVSAIKKPRLDLSLQKDAWVIGCMAALPDGTRVFPAH